MASTPADAIQAQIAAAKVELSEKKRNYNEAKQQVSDAEQRQLLRRQLDAIQEESAFYANLTTNNHRNRHLIDRDEWGPHKPGSSLAAARATDSIRRQAVQGQTVRAESAITCDDAVAKGEYVWKIHGMSWIRGALEQSQDTYAASEGLFQLHDDQFWFIYNPGRGAIESGAIENDCASLAIRHVADHEHGLFLAYRVYIKRKDGEFVQWGQQAYECHPDQDTSDMLFGPDVCDERQGLAKGIFGLSHEELLQSEWVEQDTLTVRFELEVRAHTGYDELPMKKAKVEVPEPSISSDFLGLLQNGKWSDVTFRVKGEAIKAHSLILCCRSEVFERQLCGGLQESISKEVVVEDCEPKAFKALLRFLYVDDFSHFEDCMQDVLMAKESSGTEEDASPAERKNSGVGPQIAFLQDVLSASHKYQLPRLSLWCEKQLCERTTVAEACLVLCQAHLCEAQQLEEICLKLIKDNMEQVVSTQDFKHLTAQWPEVLLKIALFGSGVSASKAASAVAEQQTLLRKRKRES